MADRIQLIGSAGTDAQLAGKRRYKLFRTREDGREEQITHFNSQAEMIEFMQDSTYHSDPVLRATVQDLVGRSIKAGVPDFATDDKKGLPKNNEMLDSMRRDMLIEQNEKIQAKLASKSATERYEAAVWLADPANAALIEEAQAVVGRTDGLMPGSLGAYIKDNGPTVVTTPTEEPANVVPSMGGNADADGSIINLGL